MIHHGNHSSISAEGLVYAWGKGDKGMCTLFSTVCFSSELATLINFFLSNFINYHATICISGQLGVGNHESYSTPRKVRLPSSASLPVTVCCGPDCSMLVTSSGQLLASGSNKCVNNITPMPMHHFVCVCVCVTSKGCVVYHDRVAG